MARDETAKLRPVDLAIRVTTPWSGRSTRMQYTLDSPSSALQLHHLTIEGPQLMGKPEDFQLRLLEELEVLRKRQPDGMMLSRAEVADEAVSIGAHLFRTLFAGEMERTYRRVCGRVETLLITSDEPWIPWELLHDGEEFLCLRFRMGRWLAGGRAPLAELEVRNLLGLRASTEESAWNELEILRRLEASSGRLAGIFEEGVTFQTIRNHLQDTSFEFLHFSGHGDHDLEGSLEARIHAEDRPFRPRNIAPAARARLLDQRPFVFLNSCQVGRVGLALTGLEGWAPTWVDCGCAGFLAPSLPVSDSSAYEFARSFYDGIERGLDLGTAVHEARLTLRREHPADLAWLAYVLYGTPQARIHFGSQRPRASKRVEAETEVQSSGPRLVNPGRAEESVSSTGPASGAYRRDDQLPVPVHPTGTPRRRLALAAAVAVVIAAGMLILRWQQGVDTEPPEITASTAKQGHIGEVPETPPNQESEEALQMTRIPGRVAVMAMTELDPGVAQALRTWLRTLEGIEPLLVAGIHEPEQTINPGSSLQTAQFRLYVAASSEPTGNPASHLRAVVLSLDAALIDASDNSRLAQVSATHTGIGGTTDAALLQAVSRCAQEIADILKERIDS